MPDVPAGFVSPAAASPADVNVSAEDAAMEPAERPLDESLALAPGPEPLDVGAQPASTLTPPVSELLARVSGELGRLANDFALKIKYDQAKEKAIDTLTEEVRRHRAGLHFAILRPLIVDLISLHDDLADLADAWRASGNDGAKTLDSFAATVEEVLARQNVTSFRLGEPTLDTRRQRVIRTTTTDDADVVGSVAASVRPGFMCEDRVVRPEHVLVYVASAAVASPPAAESV
jgi:molecular chaperone GrpE (heat shock protein)